MNVRAEVRLRRILDDDLSCDRPHGHANYGLSAVASLPESNRAKLSRPREQEDRRGTRRKTLDERRRSAG